MKTIIHDMDLARQRRKFTSRIETAPSPAHARYLTHLLTEFDESVTRGEPQPFSHFFPAYEEEFDL